MSSRSLTSVISDCDLGWTGVVLASGQSSRMGEDKALLMWDGTPLYQHMAQLLTCAGARTVLINRSGTGQECVADIYPGRGPLSGIHAALSRCFHEALMIVPVDMPLLKPEYLRMLVSRFDGVRPLQFETYSLPLLLPVNDRVRQSVEQAITSDNRRNYALWRLFEALDGQTLPVPDGHQTNFANTNTPQEWQACQAEVD